MTNEQEISHGTEYRLSQAQDGRLLNLKQIAEDFIQNRLPSLDEGERKGPTDESAIEAINGRSRNHSDRESDLLDWLKHYKVLRYFPVDKSREIANQIIEYADGSRPAPRLPDKSSIITEYERLERRIIQAAPLCPKSGKPRDVTSLTAKALWCCYPHDIPIFDSHAERSLHVMSRLLRMAPEPTQSKYAAFLDVWLQVYDEVRPVIEKADLDGYPYKVRVLDRLLWYLGKPSFDATHSG